MENSVNHWQKVAELFLEKKLTLPEIGKLMIINEAIGLVPVTKGAERVGINVIDNSNLYDSLVFGLLKRQPQDKPISYTDLAMLLNVTPRIIGSSVNRLMSERVVIKEDRGRLGAVYSVYPDRYKVLPTWVIEFTAALIDLHNDADLKALVAAEVGKTQFYRGMEILRQEIRDKFYRPKKASQEAENTVGDQADPRLLGDA